MEIILWSLAVLGGLGILFGIGLGVASKKLAVEVDQRVIDIRENLPGANCGGCGFPGCDGFAAALVKGEAEPSGCSVCSKEAASKIGEILGVEVTQGVRKVARILCQGDEGHCGNKAEYDGVMDCRAAMLVAGGFRKCKFGCIGLGTCAAVCPFGAIVLGDDGIARIDEEQCTGCGKCVEACPQHGIVLMDETVDTYLACRNTDFGKAVISVCSAGCIGCKMCAKVCPEGAIEIVNNLPVIDQEKCTGCGLCKEKCKPGCLIGGTPREEMKEAVNA